MSGKNNLTYEQLLRFEQLRQMTPDAYEKICKGCGLCCLCKTGTDDFVVYTRLSCNWLDLKTKRCTVYNNRLRSQKYECAKVTPELAVQGDLLPRTCGYVEYIYGPATPIKFDWSRVVPLGKVNEEDVLTMIKYMIIDSINWKHR